MAYTIILLSFVTAFLLDVVSPTLHGSDNVSYSVVNRSKRNSELKCTLPSQPENGQYKVTGGNVINGRALVLNLQYTCNPTYALVGDSSAFCYDGEWTPEELPKCVRIRDSPFCRACMEDEEIVSHMILHCPTMSDNRVIYHGSTESLPEITSNIKGLLDFFETCRLTKHRSVIYNCLISGTDATRTCRDAEPGGTVVQPVCKQPHYYTPIELPYMHCANGRWNAWPTCMPECGLLTPKGAEATRSGVPWQAAVYYKYVIDATHEHICSGALISNSVVLSAAHCFWNEDTKTKGDEVNYAVAVGKLYSEWSHPDDEEYAQRSDVKKIVIPKEYRGDETHYQDDIAVVVVTRSFEYQHHIRPVCLDFKQEMNNKQLVKGTTGKSAGYGLSNVSSPKSLQLIDLPFVSNEDCFSKSSSDKFCAGNVNGPGLCGADSGSGITFSATLQNTTRHYLRGIASVTINATARCKTYTSFNSIMKYQNLIKTYWFL